jgi:hypothetical protein
MPRRRLIPLSRVAPGRVPTYQQALCFRVEQQALMSSDTLLRTEYRTLIAVMRM